MPETDVLFLPSEIPVIQVELSGYAATRSSDTVLEPTGLAECDRTTCVLRGDCVPPLSTASMAMAQAGKIAAEMQRNFVFGRRKRSLASLFHVKVTAGIAMPPARLASEMSHGGATETWELIRPFAEDGDFHGIDLPNGRIIFRRAQLAGHYRETLLAKVPAF